MLKTVVEISNWAQHYALPLEKMRFFPGEERIDPQCFYVFCDRFTGEWVVAKNKTDGSRAERYRGRDQAEACRIFLDKMAQEAANRGLTLPTMEPVADDQTTPAVSDGQNADGWQSYQAPDAGQYSYQPQGGSTYTGGNKPVKKKSRWWKILIIAAAVIVGFKAVSYVFNNLWPDKGYYLVDKAIWFYDDGWYSYDPDSQSWNADSAKYDWKHDWKDYYIGQDYYPPDLSGEWDGYEGECAAYSDYDDWYNNYFVPVYFASGISGGTVDNSFYDTDDYYYFDGYFGGYYDDYYDTYYDDDSTWDSWDSDDSDWDSDWDSGDSYDSWDSGGSDWDSDWH